jgi:hypothetical protein
MVGYRRCIWSGGKACGRRTGRRICRSGSAGREWTRPALRPFACHSGGTASPRSGALRPAPGFGNSRHLFILRHITGQLLNDVNGGTVGSPAASDAAESTASKRHYRLALGLGRQDQGQSHDGRTSGAAGYALRPSDEVREFGRQVVVPLPPVDPGPVCQPPWLVRRGETLPPDCVSVSILLPDVLLPMTGDAG